MGSKGNSMGPAIALRLRQHLTLTPQVQQALRLLQMSALEFAQEMEQALSANPFLEENPEAPAPAQRDGATTEGVVITQDSFSVPQESFSSGAARSEEHTSELQSLAYLVCRLLLS